MIITRTPFRISLFGGGSDFPAWYTQFGGVVVSFSIDKYCYLTTRILPPFFPHRFRLAYSRVETITELNEMEHPAIREAIRKYFPYEGLEIHHHGDLPARSGVGSSSAFAVGIIHSLKKLRKDRNIDKFTLAKDAIELEQTILRDNVGSQDQIACAYGNFNKISFLQEDKGFIVEPISISPTYAKSMLSRMVLVYTGLPRMSSNISKGLLANLPRKKKLILRTMEMAEESHKLFQAEADLDFMGDFLKENWSLKSSMNEKAITPPLNQLYEEAIKYGAEGGKVLGAGGGGFLLFWLADGARDYFLKKFDRGTVVPFAFEKFGTQTIFDSHEIV